MSTLRLGRVLLGLAALVALGAGPALASSSPTASPEHHRPAAGGPSAAELARMRAATAEFHSIAEADQAGYVLFRDVNGVACIDMPGMGGMGVHFVNPALIADPALDPSRPEALVYAPDRDGTLRLAALEFLVDRSAWDAHHTRPPKLFRQAPFDRTAAPNRYGLAPFYSQHAWVWKPNPAGVLAMWNPRVDC